MKRTDVTTTTIDLDERDRECITAIQEHILREEKPIYTVSRRVAISWALRKIAEGIKNGNQQTLE